MFKEKVLKKYRLHADDRSIYTDESGKFWGDAGAGGVFLADDTKNLCIQKRSPHVNEPNTWGTWGGAIERGESPEEAVKREIHEETGYDGAFTLEPLSVYKNGKFRFYNYLIRVPHEFQPKHSWETSDHAWVSLDDLPSPLHFGFQELLPLLKKRLGAKS